MRAIVTGGTGFIGRHVVEELLSEGHEVKVLVRTPASADDLAKRGVEVVAGNLEDPDSVAAAMKGSDVFYHIGEIKNRNRKASESNIRLVERIAENMNRAGCTRLVFVSSVTVSGIPSLVPADEEAPAELDLNDHYTAYKRSCEKVISGHGGFEFAILRPAPVYGPGSRYLGTLVRALETVGPWGIPFIGDAKNAAPLIFVTDLAKAIHLAGVRSEAAGQVFNITDGIPHSWHDFLKTISDVLGKSLRVIPVPPLLLKFSAVPVDFLSFLFGAELDPLRYVSYFSRDLLFDVTKAKRLLEWTPRPDFKSCVEEMVAHYKGK